MRLRQKVVPILCCMTLMAGCASLATSPAGETVLPEKSVLPVSNLPPDVGQASAPEESAPEETGSTVYSDAPETRSMSMREETVASVTPRMQARIAEQKRAYPDTVGWLTVPGTTIDSAVVQGDDPTNEYYLNHDLDGNRDRNGTYSVHVRCNMTPGTREEISKNITVFAHNHDENPDGILFAQLKKYKDPAFAEANPYLFFSADGEDMVWEVFAVFDTVKQFDYIEPNPSRYQLQKIADAAKAASIYDYGITVSGEDNILTLSTCSFDVPGVGLLPTSVQNDYRFVVMARLVSPDEPLKETADFTERNDFLLPHDFPTLDAIYYEGEAYVLGEWILDNAGVQPINDSELVLKGTVGRTVFSDDHSDWDATFLPAGTEVYVDPAHPMMFLVQTQDGWLPYWPWIEELTPTAMELLLVEDDRTVARLPVNAATDARLWSIADMADGYVLSDPDYIVPSDAKQVVLAVRYPIYTVHNRFYVGSVDPSGRDVMVVQGFDGDYYKEAVWFDRLMDLFVN